MNRRELLAAGAIVAVSGCLGESDGQDDPPGNDDDSGGSSNGRSQGSEANAEALTNAFDYIEEAGDRLEEEAELSFVTDLDDPLDTSAIETAIARAEGALENFNEGEANDDQLASYERAELSIEYLSAMLDVLNELELAYEALETAGSYENNERHGDGADQLQMAADYFTGAASLPDGARESWSAFQAQDFDDELNLADGEDVLDELAEVCDATIRYCEAGVHLDEGLEAYFEGSDLFEQERFSAAGSAYADANESFTEANSQYKSAETEVPSSFQGSFISQNL